LVTGSPAGGGAKGSRHYDWAAIDLLPEAVAGVHRLLIRRNCTTGELANYRSTRGRLQTDLAQSRNDASVTAASYEAAVFSYRVAKWSQRGWCDRGVEVVRGFLCGFATRHDATAACEAAVSLASCPLWARSV
jgi:hypothetical protein